MGINVSSVYVVLWFMDYGDIVYAAKCFIFAYCPRMSGRSMDIDVFSMYNNP